MPLRTFTFFRLGQDLDGIAPGFGLTIDYDILEGLIASVRSSQPPAHLRDELQQLAEEHRCDFRDFRDHRFIQFVKR